jgi:carbonic anhydrase
MSPDFAPLVENLPREPGDSLHFEHVTLHVDDLLPRDRRYYRYEGSLTTPPCSEGVHWLVMVEPVELSRQQIEAFRSVMEVNNRPVQPRNDRRLTLETAAE